MTIEPATLRQDDTRFMSNNNNNPVKFCRRLSLLLSACAVATFPLMLNAASGDITTFAGTGTSGDAGDNGVAVSAQLDAPRRVAVDSDGNVYIGDHFNNRIRKVTVSTGIITTLAGKDDFGFSGDNGAATNATLNEPDGIAVDAAGNTYIADYSNHRVRKVDAVTGVITTIAGTGMAGFSGDSNAATLAQLNAPIDVEVDRQGNVFIADYSNQRIRKIDKATGVITTVAGIGTAGFSGDGGNALQAELNFPTGIALDDAGNIYIADKNNDRIRKVTVATGLITTIAGSATASGLGDGGAATAAELKEPRDVALDAAGDVYIADRSDARIRKVTLSTGVITTVAGSGNNGDSGDGGSATSAALNAPSGVVLDEAGNLYIADFVNNKIRKVEDIVPPLTTTYQPANGALDVESNPVLSVTFHEAIAKGTGDISIRKASDDSVAATIAVGANTVSISDKTATITLDNALAAGESYYVTIDASAFVDKANLSFKGVSDKVSWRFTTANSTAPNTTATTYTLASEYGSQSQGGSGAVWLWELVIASVLLGFLRRRRAVTQHN